MSRRITYKGTKNADKLVLSLDASSESNLRIDTHSGQPCLILWGDGDSEMLSSGSTLTHSYTTAFTGDVVVVTFGGYSDISRFQSNGATAWNFDLGVFVPLTGLVDFRLYDLPNANITGSLNSFSGTTGLTYFSILRLPNANITGSINSFTGATGLTYFYLYDLPNANITGDSSAFANKTNISSFYLYTSPTSTITMNYDDILNVWNSSVYVRYSGSGISANKATTSPFNFDSITSSVMFFQGIGLSTASMDNMIIALNNSLIAQTSPKTIRLDQNAPHSGSPAVMTALSNLATKNITVVL